MKMTERLSEMRFAATYGLAILVGSIELASAGETTANPHDSEVSLVFDQYQELLAEKERLRSGSPEATAEFNVLIRQADRALQQPLVSVVQKKAVAPSGDRHDYLSLAPYWWPDPDSPDGLPYIRRDGRVNPTARGENVDRPAAAALFSRVNALALAGFFADDARYYRRAAEQLEAWFVDPATRMNPHLNFAQGIPGRNPGRGFGIIEWARIGRLITPLQLLHGRGEISEASYQAIRQWLADYLDWLQYSEFGKFEQTRSNNHGTWYDVQVVGLLLLLDRRQEAREILETRTKQRIASQIEPDGRQPLELSRTKSLSYSKMNLAGFKQLAALGEKVGVDLWNYQTEDGRSIRAAEEFLEPYLSGQKEWPFPQL